MGDRELVLVNSPCSVWRGSRREISVGSLDEGPGRPRADDSRLLTHYGEDVSDEENGRNNSLMLPPGRVDNNDDYVSDADDSHSKQCTANLFVRQRDIPKLTSHANSEEYEDDPQVVASASNSSSSGRTTASSSSPSHGGDYGASHARNRHRGETDRQKQKQERLDLEDDDDIHGQFLTDDMLSETSNADDSDEEDGSMVLHKVFGRKVIRLGNRVVKSGKSISTAEVEALRLAEKLRLPAPRVHAVDQDSRGELSITMDYIEGDILEDAWPNMTPREKQSIAQQLKGILLAMRAATPLEPPGPGPGLSPSDAAKTTSKALVTIRKNMTACSVASTRRSQGDEMHEQPQPLIASCNGGPVKDAHHYFDYDGGPFCTEAEFNDFLLSTLVDDVPPAIARALASRLTTGHRVVFTHGDLNQRNIIVRDAKIVALVDWEYSGWYPEYWEFVKFQGRFCRHPDWMAFSDGIFPTEYTDELVNYVALTHWQRP